MLNFQQTEFIQSAAIPAQFPADEGAEVAFVGRSNAGKSTAINVICQQKHLAKTSKTPGRTRLINFFDVTPDCRLVDLPGYGFAKAAKSEQKRWHQLIETYFRTRQSIRGLICLMDCRHPLQPLDKDLIAMAEQLDCPVHILLTKSDKLSNNQSRAALQTVQKALKGSAATVQLFSGSKRTGVESVHAMLDQWLQVQ